MESVMKQAPLWHKKYFLRAKPRVNITLPSF